MKKTLIYLIGLVFGLNLSLAQTKIISEGDEWYYYDDKSAPPKEWINNNYIYTDWKKGISPLGYGDDRIKTVISYGNNKSKKHITKYFKKTFRIDDPYEYLVYELKLQRDDGIVLYLNGRELLRDNMPENDTITHKTKANSLVRSDREEVIYTELIFPDNLIVGNNTISASVHQSRVTSSDCLFNLELIGDNNPNKIPIVLKERTIQNLSLDLKLKELNHKLELEKKDLQFGFLQKSNTSLKITIYIIIALLVLSIIGISLLWKKHTTKEKKLSENIFGLEEINRRKDQEMMSNSIKLLDNQQYLKEIKKELEDTIKEDTTSIKKELKKIVNQIEYNLENEEDWENLKKHFNVIHTGFFDKLIKQHPSLSEIELRHCIFIKLYMQTKEIARIMHIDPRSVQASRYRIKKKMNLDENTDLREYLLNL
ncbi:hypothetical protein D1816_20825 [Aquimarina sp. AD10]|uniref:helix-turn-helix transcriptional regulator n=1 Tax=Aquimarina TaxID=290174 RepID=UPI000E4965EF|nr:MULTISPECIES: LuxR C-terminal-related transcriptional regulator [Aquimarina]AXT62685.1 hypothetical protein D1816_20825 [Aquimarina sp. AD10]RKN01868.1 hypothetical protein D7033_02190 [Aquimarina sp. AD10]